MTRPRTGSHTLRATSAYLLLAVVTVAAAWWGLTLGSADIGGREVFDALTGHASTGITKVVLDLRLPRTVFVLVGGASLAAAGAVFQSLTRNPLGSPDIIGLGAGAWTGVLVGSWIGLAGTWSVPGSALVGGLATGLAVYLLARTPQGTAGSGLRIVVIGIGITMLLGAVDAWLVQRLDLQQAIVSSAWGAGDVSHMTWQLTWPTLVAAGLTGAVMLTNQREMTLMEMGDELASGLGIRVPLVRGLQFVAATCLVSVVTAAAGPISFVALAAPQLARGATGSSSVRVLPSALFGAALLTLSDAVSRSPLLPQEVPVGVVTTVVGGLYFLGLLVRLSNRRMR